MNRKQAALLLVLGIVLWIPMTIFLFRFADGYSDRQLAIIGAINLLACSGILIFSYRRGISKL